MLAAESQIRINTLLLEREALFLRVHELENAAAAILGEPFPFTRSPLPSDKRSKKKRKPTKAKTADSKIKIRKLETGETVYRVTYAQGGEIITELHDTPEPLATLLATQSARLKVQTIETLDQAGSPIAHLHGEPTP